MSTRPDDLKTTQASELRRRGQNVTAHTLNTDKQQRGIKIDWQGKFIFLYSTFRNFSSKGLAVPSLSSPSWREALSGRLSELDSVACQLAHCLLPTLRMAETVCQSGIIGNCKGGITVPRHIVLLKERFLVFSMTSGNRR